MSFAETSDDFKQQTRTYRSARDFVRNARPADEPPAALFGNLWPSRISGRAVDRLLARALKAIVRRQFAKLFGGLWPLVSRPGASPKVVCAVCAAEGFEALRCEQMRPGLCILKEVEAVREASV
jgi:hypothetical protein